VVSWSKRTAERVCGTAGPFTVDVTRKGDGRWDWKIFADGAESPLAAGISPTVGAAKTKCEQFVARSGRI
jgi:hypothetical protein